MPNRLKPAKLISDGTPNGTHVYDIEGKEIKGISKVEWLISPSTSGMMRLTFPVVECDVIGDLC